MITTSCRRRNANQQLTSRTCFTAPTCWPDKHSPEALLAFFDFPAEHWDHPPGMKPCYYKYLPHSSRWYWPTRKIKPKFTLIVRLRRQFMHIATVFCFRLRFNREGKRDHSELRNAEIVRLLTADEPSGLYRHQAAQRRTSIQKIILRRS